MSGAFAAGGAGLVPSYNPADFGFMSGYGIAAPDPISVLDTGSLVPTSVGIDTSVPDLGGGSGGIGALGIANAAISGLQTLGSLWMASKQMKLAKKQFKFTKDITNINLNNQMQSYNTALADRARSRGVMEGQTQDQVQQYIDSNSLTRAKGKGSGGYSVGDVSAAALNNYSSYLGRGTSGASGGSSSSASPAAAPAAGDKDKDRQG